MRLHDASRQRAAVHAYGAAIATAHAAKGVQQNSGLAASRAALSNRAPCLERHVVPKPGPAQPVLAQHDSCLQRGCAGGAPRGRARRRHQCSTLLTRCAVQDSRRCFISARTRRRAPCFRLGQPPVLVAAARGVAAGSARLRRRARNGELSLRPSLRAARDAARAARGSLPRARGERARAGARRRAKGGLARAARCKRRFRHATASASKARAVGDAHRGCTRRHHARAQVHKPCAGASTQARRLPRRRCLQLRECNRSER